MDNYLPCLEGQERLAFACSSSEGELWPSLMEKAYAKVSAWHYGGSDNRNATRGEAQAGKCQGALQLSLALMANIALHISKAKLTYL